MSPADEHELLLPLFAGAHNPAKWDQFLQRLRRRTAASQVTLFCPEADASLSPRSALAETGAERGLDTLRACGLIAEVRPQRVYALRELPSEGFAAARLAHHMTDARLIRTFNAYGSEAWLILLAGQKPFEAADGALLAALTEPLSLAMSLFAEACQMRLRTRIAEDALALAGAGQIVFGGDGQILFADATACAQTGISPNAPMRLPGEIERAIAAACRDLDNAPADERRILALDCRTVLLLRPAEPEAASANGRAAAVGLVRRASLGKSRSTEAVIGAAYGLSRRESTLCVHLLRGLSIQEAARATGLSEETARNYTKRIYGKIGVRGHADLLRRLLSGVVAFC